MGNRAQNILKTFIALLTVSVIFMVIKNNDNKITLSVLCFITCCAYAAINKIIEQDKKYNSMFKPTAFLNSAIISVLALLDSTGISVVFYLIAIGQVTMNSSVKFGFYFALFNYIVYVIVIFLKLGTMNFYTLFVITLNFSFAYILMYFLKYQITQRLKVQLISKELELKTKELQKAYEKLQEVYDAKEEVIILKERNRIAGEIHDTIGHTLTTVLVKMEASKRLMKKDVDLALDKFNAAQEQVRKGLNDIRKSVRALKEGEDLLDFVNLLHAFISEVENNSGVSIEYSFSKIPNLDKKIENTLYRALQESITNGIRHGGSNKFELQILYKDNKIEFTVKDNGSGSEDLEFGFGLSNIKYKVEGLGGTFSVESKANEGTTIRIEIPVNEVEENE